MKLLQPGLQYYAKRIEDNEPFTFIRYGDGEWAAILNESRQRTGSGSHSLKFPKMQQALRRSLTECPHNENYIVALRQTAMKSAINQWIAQNANGLNWHDCTVFYKASKKGRLYPFVKAVKESALPLVVVGPRWLRKLSRVFKGMTFVEIPPRDCWKKHDEIVTRTLAVANGGAIISISAGPPAKVFAWRLYKEFEQRGQHNFILDLGTLWDPYCGKRSRQYMKRMTPDTIRRNTHGE
jgi:hypothetical protein